MTNTENLSLAVVAESAIDEYRFAKLGTAEKQVVPATAGTDVVIGVTKDDCGLTAGNAVTIQTGGTAKLKAGGTISAGDYITAGVDGKAVKTTTAGHTVRGIALVDGVDGDVIEVQLVHFIHA